jgi:MOSC domain-containing protein YiiM
MPNLCSIVYKPANAAAPETGYTRIPLQQAELVAGYGIDGDMKGGGKDRQLNIMTADTATLLGDEGFMAAAGQLGEQLMIAGLDVDALAPGDRIKIGESAIIEISEPRTGCAKFERHQGKLRTEAAGRLGMMARVVAGGTVKVGDEVTAA